MTVTRITAFATPTPVESPREAIELVFEQLNVDRTSGDTDLDRKALFRHFKTLRRGFGCNDTALPVQLVTLRVQALEDKKFSISASAFIDVLWDFWQLIGAEEEVVIIDEFDEVSVVAA